MSTFIEVKCFADGAPLWFNVDHLVAITTSRYEGAELHLVGRETPILVRESLESLTEAIRMVTR